MIKHSDWCPGPSLCPECRALAEEKMRERTPEERAATAQAVTQRFSKQRKDVFDD